MTALDQTWKVELHSHTLYSRDCLTPLQTMIAACQRKGIDQIAITDHNTAEGALALAKRAPDLIIVGEEIMTTQGELLGYFLKESIPAGLTPDETIRRLRDQGAVISVAHPYDRLRKGAWQEKDLLAIIDRVDALEVFNSRCIYSEDNDKAQQLAVARGKLATVGSDAHIPYELGHATLVMSPFEGAGSFFEALRSARPVTQISPSWVHLASKQAKWFKKLGLRQRLWEGG